MPKAKPGRSRGSMNATPARVRAERIIVSLATLNMLQELLAALRRTLAGMINRKSTVESNGTRGTTSLPGFSLAT